MGSSAEPSPSTAACGGGITNAAVDRGRGYGALDLSIAGARARPVNGFTLFRGETSMASFVPWYGKKRSRLEEREEEFLEVLRSGASETRVTEAVETLRTAQVRALKEKRQKFAPSEKNSAVYREIEEAIRWWMDLPKDAIIEGYREPKRRRKMSSAVRRAAK